ncbi:hypothetical protein [Amycolatopsis dongchuanensis]|uniref:Uncharacterized protein n=1 Tax=Amycolatopsis dongchuanensis TaxID=1070866 RepID=A0ABP9Q7E6_9PSEU
MTEQLESRVVVAEATAKEALEIAKTAREDARMATEAWRARQRMDNALLNSLRATQLEHGKILEEHGRRLDRLERKVDRLERKVDEGFTKISLGMSQIVALITNLQR